MSESIVDSLRSHQRMRVWYIKSRNMIMNRLRATVANTLGYGTALSEAQRKELFLEADKLIKQVMKGESKSTIQEIILVTMQSVQAFDGMREQHEKEMRLLAEQLPIKAWVDEEQQRGFGILSLATIVGECGDLASYSNPGKLWKRMMLAPFASGGKILMGATWRSGKEGKLTAEEWTQYGYCPRRRSISFLIGENVVKQNKSIYRERYETTKAECQKRHPDYSKLRCHRHAMLLATKLLLKNLWLTWNKDTIEYRPWDLTHTCYDSFSHHGNPR